MATVTDQLLAENSAEESYVPVGVGGLLAASEKLLAVNRGLIPTDERDSLQFKKILPTHALIKERIEMDSGKLRQAILRRAAKTKSLKGMYPFVFDPYVEGQLVSNPLSSPLEEINPMQLVESARRMTLMGPGGLGSEDAITEEAQAIHPSTFGFISALEGPESARIGIDSRMSWGTKLGSDGHIYQRFYDRSRGKHRWMSPQEIGNGVIGLPE